MSANAQQSAVADMVGGAITRGINTTDAMAAKGRFRITCHDKDGTLKWEAETPNLVVDVGLQDMNTQYFKGATYSATWYIGLYGAGATNNPAAGDTMASHAGWTEVTTYSNATRPAATFGTATTANPSVISNTAAPAAFNINGSATVGGAFLVTNNTKGGTTGTLFSAGDFSAPGDRAVASGDVLNVTYTFNLTAV